VVWRWWVIGSADRFAIPPRGAAAVARPPRRGQTGASAAPCRG
jgi:hypothetical protein